MTLSAILIDPITRTIAEIEVVYGLDGILEALETDPQFSGTVDRHALGPCSDLWFDTGFARDKGRPVFELAGRKFAGVCVILDHDGRGNSVAATYPLALVASGIRWTGLETTGNARGPIYRWRI
jgi:hypothetical protein